MSFDVTLGPRVRKSPFFESTVAAGVRQFTIYNHMYLPIGYGDLEAEYRRLMTGVAMWDVAAQRQVEIHGPDAADLVRYLTRGAWIKWCLGAANTCRCATIMDA